jgi:hypothetical protein
MKGEKIMKKKLLAYGFREAKKTQSYTLLTLDIHGMDDRFKTSLYWYSDQPKKIYINVFKLSGTQSISESDLFANTKGLYSGAVTNWESFKAAFPEIKVAL